MGCAAEHGADGAAKQNVGQRGSVVEERRQRGEAKGNVTCCPSCRAGVLLFGYPSQWPWGHNCCRLWICSSAAEAGMGAVRRGAAVTAHAYGACTTGEYTFEGEFAPVQRYSVGRIEHNILWLE